MKSSTHKNRAMGQSDIVTSRWWATSRRFAVLVLTILSIALFTPTTFASGPNSKPQGTPHGSSTQQDPQWLKAKNEYRVFSGIIAGQDKGVHSHPSILSRPFFNPSAGSANMTPDTGAPSSYTLGTGPYYVSEPSDGNNINFPGTSNTYDDKYHHYNDKYMYTLCGPGSVDVALDYWPWPSNLGNYTNVNDPINAAQSTNWNGTDLDSTTRMRGYMVHLAFQVEAPTWAGPGMLMQSYIQSGQLGGATLQAVRDGLNWEASGENSSNWSSYFYIVSWKSSFTTESVLESALHTDVVTDIAYNYVPVIVEIPAKSAYLPNWPNGTGVYHFVTIVGYNDNTGQYTYVDTCKGFTGCNPGGIDSPDFHVVSQHSLAQGVYSIPTNTTTGDGGWVW